MQWLHSRLTIAIRFTAVSCLMVAAITAGCGPGNGDEFTFALATGGDSCQGVHVVVDVSAVDATDSVTCTAARAVMDAGCEASATVGGDSLGLDLRGCSVPDHATLFACTVPGGDADALETSAVVGCGCGCRDACADSAAICVTAGETSGCGESATVVASSGDGPTAGFTVTVQRGIVTPTTTSSTTCGTCCDAGLGVDAQLDDDVTLSELAFTIDISNSQPGCPLFDDCTLAIATAGDGYARFNATDETIEVCVSDPDGFSGPALLAQCSYFSGGPGDPYDVEVTRALDTSFRPVDPAPSVTAASTL